MNGLCVGEEKVNWTESPINDSITSGVKTWSSSKISTLLNNKADKATVQALADNMSNLESTLAGKADASSLGTQLNYSLSGSTLTITNKA